MSGQRQDLIPRKEPTADRCVKKEVDHEVEQQDGKECQGTILNERGEIIDVKRNKFVPGVSPKIPLNSTMTVYGKRRSGKSIFLRWFTICYLRFWIPWFWCFTHTKHNYFFEGFMPSKFIMADFSGDILEEIMKRQITGILTAVKQKQGTINPLNPRACVFWDDYNGNVSRNHNSFSLLFLVVYKYIFMIC